MNEAEYYETMIQRYAVDDGAVERRACAPIPKKRVVWRKATAIALASFAVLVATVLLIPKARAEVFSWFRPAGPGRYLTEDPDARAPVEALDSLILPPATEVAEEHVPTVKETDAPIMEEPHTPVGSFTNNKILAVCDEPIWQQIAADFCMELGESMFDGHDLYLSVTMKGLSALPTVEAFTGGNATQVRIGKDDLAQYFEHGKVPETYQNGTVSLYEPQKGVFFLVLEDGTEVPFGPISMPDFDNPIGRRHGHELLTEAEREQISRETVEWLKGKEIKGVIRKWEVNGPDVFLKDGRDVAVENALHALLPYADENGILSGAVVYRAGTDLSGSYELFLEAELGTASFNLTAYQDIERYSAANADETVAWGAETVALSRVEIDFGKDEDSEDDDRISLYKQLVSMEGVTMTAETERAEISALGVRDLAVRIRVPESWTVEDREALAASLTFKVLLNGERGDWIVSPYGCTVEDDGTVLFTVGELVNVPYALLKSVESITLVPDVRSIRSVDMQTQDADGRNHESVGILNPTYGETAWSPFGVTGWNTEAAHTEYPQYAITLYVK